MTTKSFLDSDHEISLDEAVSIINSEIRWCYGHSGIGSSKGFETGFIAGLQQAKRLIIELAKIEEGLSTYDH